MKQIEKLRFLSKAMGGHFGQGLLDDLEMHEMTLVETCLACDESIDETRMLHESDEITFNVYTGDGNDGTSFSHSIEAYNLDLAVEAYKEGVSSDVLPHMDEDGDEDYAVLTVYEWQGATAYNDGAYFIAEIWPANKDPRV